MMSTGPLQVSVYVLYVVFVCDVVESEALSLERRVQVRRRTNVSARKGRPSMATTCCGR